MINIIILSIFVIPWLIIPLNNIPDPTRLIKSSFFDFTMMGIIVCTIIKGIKFEYKNKYLGWVAICLFVGFGFNWYYPLVRGYGYNAGTIDSNLHFIFALIATICVCSNIERKDFVKISKAVVFSATLVAIFAYLQIVGLDPMNKIATYKSKEIRHIAAFLDHPDILGNYLALSIPFFLYLLNHKYFIPLVIVLIVLICTHSSISILATIVSSIIFYSLRYRNNNKIMIGLLVIGISVIAVCVNPRFNKIASGFTGRTQAWGDILSKADNPIFGQGLGIVKAYGTKFGDNFWLFAHNDYIELYCAGGILLLFLLSLLIINSFRNFNYHEDNVLGFSYLASFVAFLILMFGSFPMEIAPLALGGLVSWWGIERLV